MNNENLRIQNKNPTLVGRIFLLALTLIFNTVFLESAVVF
jgi:hypothetical protein